MTLPVVTTVADWIGSPSGMAQLALGVILLVFGRRFFWLLVAAIGFFVGLGLADYYLSVDSEALRWVVGILAGVLAGLAAIFLQRFAVSAGGALVAGYSTYWYLSLTWDPFEVWNWVLVGAAALVGLLLARVVFDFGLIFISSLAGATLLLESLPAEASTNRWLFLVLVVLGAAVQASSVPRKDSRRRR